MSKRPSLADSLRQAAQGTEPPPSAPPAVPAPLAAAPKPVPTEAAARPAAAPPPASRPAVAFHAATRAGKKKVTAPLTPEDHKRLRHLALDRDATTEALLLEAIHDLFAKYGLAGAGQGSRTR